MAVKQQGASAAQLVDEARRASAAGATDRAIALLKSALEAEPDNAAVLNLLANRQMAAGDAESASSLLKRATSIDPNAVALWLNLAAAQRHRQCAEEEEEALDRALRLEPYLLPALLQKGELYERLDRQSEALRAYSAVLAIAGQARELPAGLEPRIDHAKTVVAELRERIGKNLRAAVDRVGRRSARFDYCLDILTGRERLYTSRPTRLHFPGLPNLAFFDRDLFPWFGELEDAVDLIRRELLGVMAASAGMRPYIDIAPTDPVNQWDKLNRSLDWSAYFLWENGRRNDENCAACPETAALVERLPLLDIPGHAPTAMFSILKPGAHIPPHNGDTNVRAVVHLPLVVPPDCGFRVGHETREWVEGVAWAFDDTIEHEAWNRSAEARAILIVDTWNPYLTEDERELLKAAEQVLKSGSALS
jgi:aspartyl/asparaginyl beta-hydroxylase (cupin superfamily)/DNA-binding SARP family transcriptional activator